MFVSISLQAFEGLLQSLKQLPNYYFVLLDIISLILQNKKSNPGWN